MTKEDQDKAVYEGSQESKKNEAKSLKQEIHSANAHLQNFLEWISDVRQKDLLGLDSGYQNLNEKTMGLRGLMLLASQPNAGKTTFCVNVAHNHLLKGGKVLYISLDMTAKDIMSKFTQLILNIDYYTLINKKDPKTGKRFDIGNKAEPKKIEGILEDFKDYFDRLLFNQNLSTSFESKEKITKNENINSNTLIIIDYLQVIKDDCSLNEMQTADKQIELVRDIQHETGCPVLTIAEARKNTDKNDKSWAQSLSDIKGSGRLVYTPDMVFLLRKENNNEDSSEKDNSNKIILDIVKVRDGGSRGAIEYEFDWQKNKFDENGIYIKKNNKKKRKTNKDPEANTIGDLL